MVAHMLAVSFALMGISLVQVVLGRRGRPRPGRHDEPPTERR